MKKVLVIGGGFAGASLARKLEKKFDVVLIDNKDYFEFTPGILRTIVEPEHIKKLQVLHTHYLKKAHFIRGEVNLVRERLISVNGKKMTFDYLAICSGSSYNLPMKESDIIPAVRAEHLRDCYSKLFNAKTILIVGGGLAGIELAAEICTHYHDKKITLVHSGERLCERNKIATSQYAENYLKKRGVRIIFGEKIIKNLGKSFVSSSGTEYKTDIAFLCTGIRPNFNFMKKIFSSSLNERNQIKVNEFLQVSGCKNIFAPGDINDLKVEKTAQNAERQADIVARNILALEKKQSLHKYIFQHTPMVVSLGKWCGIFEFDGFVLTGFIPGLLKNFIEWKEMRKLK